MSLGIFFYFMFFKNLEVEVQSQQIQLHLKKRIKTSGMPKNETFHMSASKGRLYYSMVIG